MNTHSHSQAGFTLIEMIVALAVFAVVITITLGALLMLVGSNQQIQAEQSVMTNLSFALDSMTREIRTGTNYFCAARPNYNAGGLEDIFGPANHGSDSTQEDLDLDTNHCDSGRDNNKLQGISFIEGGNSITGATAKRILYFFDENDGKIYRRAGTGPAQSIVSSGIYITNAEFFVTGTEPLSENNTDVVQPTVTIVIDAKEKDVTGAKPYHIETTITQRTLDL